MIYNLYWFRVKYEFIDVSKMGQKFQSPFSAEHFFLRWRPSSLILQAQQVQELIGTPFLQIDVFKPFYFNSQLLKQRYE